MGVPSPKAPRGGGWPPPWSPRNVRGHKNADNADIADAISTAFAGLNLPILIGIYPVRAHRMATGKETWDLH
jgi:hypothetical protein